MTFEQFFQIAITIGLGAVSTLLIWGIKELVGVSRLTAQLEAKVEGLDTRVSAIERARVAEAEGLSAMRSDVSYIRGKLDGVSAATAATPPRSTPARRRAAGA